MDRVTINKLKDIIEAHATPEERRRFNETIDVIWRTRAIKMYIKLGIPVGIILILSIFAISYLTRHYDVWAQEMVGKAKLAEATQSRQIAVEAAKARQESAVFDAEAERRRAQGVADANKIIGESLKNNESYLRYLWVNGLNNNSQNVIYVPTEANMPILEAGKRQSMVEIKK